MEKRSVAAASAIANGKIVIMRRSVIMCFSPCLAFGLPGSVIVAEINYTFTPLVGLTTIFSPGSFEMTRTFYTRPRRSMKVAKTDNG